MDMDQGPTISVFHTIWSTILSGFLGLVLWNGKRLYNTMDTKADKDVVKDKFNEIETDLRSMLERQDRRHEENIARLDRIWERLSGHPYGQERQR